MNFEIIFGDFIIDYISKITSKIKNISNYYLVIQLINFKNIQDKNKSIALDYFNKKYDNILNFEVEKLNDNGLNKIIKVIAHLVILNFLYNINWKKYEFIKNKLKILPKKIKKKIKIKKKKYF